MSDVLEVAEGLTIPIEEIELSAVRASGAGGQNVNKVATAIHLRFDIARSPALPAALKQRLLAQADRRVTADGVFVLKAQEFRTQKRNRQAALDRLREWLAAAMATPKPRKKTRPSARARRKRIEDKRRRGDLKRTRSKTDEDF